MGAVWRLYVRILDCHKGVVYAVCIGGIVFGRGFVSTKYGTNELLVFVPQPFEEMMED